MSDKYVVIIALDDVFLLRCDEKSIALEDLQAIVQGYIEVAKTELDDAVMIVNEEGKLMGLPFNRMATRIAFDAIAGNAILMRAKGDELIGFTKEEAEKLVKEVKG